MVCGSALELVFMERRWRILPPVSTIPAFKFVPPRSMPTIQLLNDINPIPEKSALLMKTPQHLLVNHLSLFLENYGKMLSAICRSVSLWKANFNKSLILSQIIYLALMYPVQRGCNEIPHCYTGSIEAKPSLTALQIDAVK